MKKDSKLDKLFNFFTRIKNDIVFIIGIFGAIVTFLLSFYWLLGIFVDIKLFDGLNVGYQILIFIGFVFTIFILSIIFSFLLKTKKLYGCENFNIYSKYTLIEKVYKKHIKKKCENEINVVIKVNTTFDVIIDPANVNKPLVSKNTDHGRFIQFMEEKGIKPKELNLKIQKSLKDFGYPIKRVIPKSEKERGNLNDYDIGTVATIKYENVVFFLVAISRFDFQNNAQSSRAEIIKSIENIIDFHNKNGQGNKLYIPVMGLSLSRSGLSKQDSYEILKSELILKADDIHSDVEVVVNKNIAHLINIR